MTNKAQELELRLVMEGLEEFATFMSYQSDYAGLRILSVETLQQAQQRELAEQASANVISFDKHRRKPSKVSISKELKFYDRHMH